MKQHHSKLAGARRSKLPGAQPSKLPRAQLNKLHGARRDTPPSPLGEPPSASETQTEGVAPYSDLYNGAVAQVMDREVHFVTDETPLPEALHAMRSIDAEFLPVVAAGKMVGLLTNSEVPARQLPANGAPPTVAGDAMIRDFAYCFEDTNIDEAAQIMQSSQVSRIPVLDRTGKLVGMVRSIKSLDASVYEPHLTD